MAGIIYKLNDIDDVLFLAREIQAKVYWGKSFEIKDREGDKIKYSDFWDYLSHERGCYYGIDTVSIDHENEIVDVYSSIEE